MFDKLKTGCIYLIKGTLNQLSYHVKKLQSTTTDEIDIKLNPNWNELRQIVQSTPPFGEHQYIIVYASEVPIDIQISPFFTLLIYISEFNGEIVSKCTKLFKACHAPYFAIKLDGNYADTLNSFINIDLTPDLKIAINQNPQAVLNTDIKELYFYYENYAEENLITEVYKGNFNFWDQNNRHIFYKYIISPGVKYVYDLKDKPFFGLPHQAWVYFNIYAKYRSKHFQLNPEWFLKLFFVWIYLSSHTLNTNKSRGLTFFISRKKDKIYTFVPSDSSIKLFTKLIRFEK
jgi:hypothetical protein